MRLMQFSDTGGGRRVAAIDAIDGGGAQVLTRATTVRDLALDAIGAGASLAEAVAMQAGDAVDVAEIAADGRLLPPLDHPDPAHCFVTGTGLTHLGSADARDKMHATLEGEAPLTDSMKIFKIGLEGGKPDGGADGSVAGVQPEWFWKGDGSCVVAPGAPLAMPAFARDGGEEPEVVGLYVVAPDGTPYRLGFALGNEFSDHVTERENYLWLAHSKLRPCAFGPELRVGELPPAVEGVSRIRRDGAVVFESEFLSGEANMSHWIANLEHHHFKYGMFRRPGDVHVHFFGTATLSFAAGIETQPGDVFEISAAGFGLPLVNPLARAVAEAVPVKAL